MYSNKIVGEGDEDDGTGMTTESNEQEETSGIIASNLVSRVTAIRSSAQRIGNHHCAT